MSELIKTYPFSKEQLKYFENEMNKAGGFDTLMIHKNAFSHDEEETIAVIYPDIEGYKEKYLTGIYEPLREHYDTEAPFMFWGRMYEMLANKTTNLNSPN